MQLRWLGVLGLLPCLALACAKSGIDPYEVEAPTLATDPVDVSFEGGVPERPDSGFTSCAEATVEAKVVKLPVDIIWIVDNSSSMQPAVASLQAGLNSFASLVGTKGLDYKVIMLSLRGSSPTTSSNGTRYPVCVPAPLGGVDCGNGPRFFHAPMDVKSTQPLEQLLGTLDQTEGYKQGQERGSEPWAQELRAGASRSIVIVTDDNSRLSATDFETFAGGANPGNPTFLLPPGVNHPSRSGQFAGYSFSAIYGFGSPNDPSARCTFSGGGQPPSSGPVYTTLVKKTKGARASLCAGSAAWAPFFDDVAKAVESTAKVACELAIPAPTEGAIDPARVNVELDQTAVPRVASAADCGTTPGWYYDDPAKPSQVIMCGATCAGAQTKKVDVVFGCQTVVR